MIERELLRLIADVKKDEKLRKRLKNTRQSSDPIPEFCRICLESGYQVYPGELLAYGEDMNDSKLRATNGGGSFEIDGWSDAFENVLDEIFGNN